MVDINEIQSILKDIIKERELTGEGIKHVVESILMLESYKTDSYNAQTLKKQQEMYTQLGEEYMYGGQS